MPKLESQIKEEDVSISKQGVEQSPQALPVQDTAMLREQINMQKPEEVFNG